MYTPYLNEKVIAINCACSRQVHLLTVTVRQDEEDGPEMIFSTQLLPGTFWQKLKLAVRFLLGRVEPWGHWDTTLISKPDAILLKDVLEQFLKDIHEHEAKSNPAHSQ